MFIVLNPKSKPEHALKDWDLWGPLIMCLYLSVILAITAKQGETTILFTGVFSIISFGSIMVTVNFILLGSTVTLFPGISAIGYCLVPICVSATLISILSYLIIKIIIIPLSLLWSISCVTRFFEDQIPPSKKVLGIYPCALLYSIISWIIFMI